MNYNPITVLQEIARDIPKYLHKEIRQYEEQILSLNDALVKAEAKLAHAEIELDAWHEYSQIVESDMDIQEEYIADLETRLFGAPLEEEYETNTEDDFQEMNDELQEELEELSDQKSLKQAIKKNKELVKLINSRIGFLEALMKD